MGHDANGYRRGCRCGVCRTGYLAYKRASHARQWAKRCAMVDALKDKPCADCGIQYLPPAMDFDHLPGVDKLFDIANHKMGAWSDVLAEIAKCEVVCSNCHRIRTWSRGRAE